MDELRFYEDDFKENPRDSERSDKVVRSWMNQRTRYAVEDIADSRCLRIVAERLVVRRIILGLSGLDTAYLNRVASVGVFGPGSPSYADLAQPHVFVAMAFVPLTPAEGEDGNPCLARLYCVGGLRERHKLPLAGMDEPALQATSWFLEGLPSGMSAKDVTGRSWLLAAHLLARVVANRDIRTARNLARHYIVTGDVSLGEIRPVETLRKAELSQKQFLDFKWIMPKENNMNIPTWKSEKPKTLDEAYQVIESMQSVATRSFFNALRKADIAEVKVQRAQMGADVYALEKDTGLSALEVVAQELEKIRKDASLSDDERGQRMGVLREIMMWLKQETADCAMMFYLLAQAGNEAAILSCKETYPINAVDENGLTAVDWALNEGDFDTAKKLHSLGGHCNARFGGNEKLHQAIKRFFFTCESLTPEGNRLFGHADLREKSPDSADRNLIINAIMTGLNPSLKIHVDAALLKDWHDWRSERIKGTLTGSLFALAMLHHDVRIVEACLENGITPNASPDVCARSDTRLADSIRCHINRNAVKKRINALLEEPMRLGVPADESIADEITDLRQIATLLEKHGFPYYLSLEDLDCDRDYKDSEFSHYVEFSEEEMDAPININEVEAPGGCVRVVVRDVDEESKETTFRKVMSSLMCMRAIFANARFEDLEDIHDFFVKVGRLAPYKKNPDKVAELTRKLRELDGDFKALTRQRDELRAEIAALRAARTGVASDIAETRAALAAGDTAGNEETEEERSARHKRRIERSRERDRKRKEAEEREDEEEGYYF